MRCLSMKEPWLDLVLRGHKTIETRTWRTRHRGPLLLASSKAIDEEALERFTEDLWYLGDEQWEHPLGYIRGVCSIVSVKHPIGDDPERRAAMLDTEGLWMWRLEHVHRFDQPMPIRGMPGVFDVELVSMILGGEIRFWAAANGYDCEFILDVRYPEQAEVICELPISKVRDE